MRLSEHDYTDPLDADHMDLSVSAPIIFPNYTFPKAYHDLALLKLGRKLTFRVGFFFNNFKFYICCTTIQIF